MDRSKRKLDIDIKNMFNELCRIACGEDLINSEALIAEDLSDLAAYYDMAYMCGPCVPSGSSIEHVRSQADITSKL